MVTVLTRRFSLIGLAGVCLMLLGSRDVEAAHSPRIEAFPPDLSVLSAPPERVYIRFSSGIDARATRIALDGPRDSSSLSVEGSGGEPVRELSIPVQDQGRGRYLVRWEVEAVTGEKYGGRVRLVVRN